MIELLISQILSQIPQIVSFSFVHVLVDWIFGFKRIINLDSSFQKWISYAEYNNWIIDVLNWIYDITKYSLVSWIEFLQCFYKCSVGIVD